jgi:hypothetical protein
MAARRRDLVIGASSVDRVAVFIDEDAWEVELARRSAIIR